MPRGDRLTIQLILDGAIFDGYTADDIPSCDLHLAIIICRFQFDIPGTMTVTELLLPLLAVVLAAALSACLTWAVRPCFCVTPLQSRMHVPRIAFRPHKEAASQWLRPRCWSRAIISDYVGTDQFRPPGGGIRRYAVHCTWWDWRTMSNQSRYCRDCCCKPSRSAPLYFTAPNEARIVPACPEWIEHGLIFLAGLWFVNFVNFMDGLDWMTVAEVVPFTGAMVTLGLLGDVSLSVTIVAAALGGAMIGFAPFNRPVAKIFLGDVGSLPIGLLLGWCLLELLSRHHVAAAFLLPLYYLADATVTLLRRLARREAIWTAHRSHFYQQATKRPHGISHSE